MDEYPFHHFIHYKTVRDSHVSYSTARDAPANILISCNDVFADIANALIFNGEQVISSDDLEDTSRLSAYYFDERYHYQARDIIKYVKDHGFRALMISIENMFYKKDTYPAKCISYDGATYGEMYRIDDILEIIPIVIYYDDAPWDDHLSLSDSFHTPDRFSHRSPQLHTSDYHINVFQVAQFTDDIIDRFHSDFRIIADFIAHKHTNPQYMGSDQIIEHPVEFFSLMYAISGDERFKMTIRQKEERRPKTMKLWSQEYLNQVETSGIVKGENKRSMEMATKVITDHADITDEKLAYYTGLSVDEIQDIKSNLENN